MSNTTNFETSKKLSQYVKIPCKRYHRESKETGEVFEADFSDAMIELGSEVYNFYPAPTLEELLRVSPFHLLLDCDSDGTGIDIQREEDDIIYTYGFYSISDNLAQAVGEIMLQYYEGRK